MAFHLKRNVFIVFILFALLELSKCQDKQLSGSEEEDDSSSEETIEESNENPQTQRRRRRSNSWDSGVDPDDPKSKEIEVKKNRALPGLPDPMAILKIAEILTTVGQEVLPLIVQGNSISNFVTDRIDRDLKFISNIRNEINERMKRK